MYHDTLGNDTRVYGKSSVSYFISDNYGRSIYWGKGNFKGDYARVILMMLNPDGTYDPETGVIELTNLFTYQDELLRFKERNGWNEEWQGAKEPEKI
jgi:hypothetical protein